VARLPVRSTPWSQRAECHDRAAEIVRARDVGQGGPVELSDGGDDGVRAQPLAVVQGELPHRAALVELGRSDAGSQPQAGPSPCSADSDLR
jgi:hypothetical protein